MSDEKLTNNGYQPKPSERIDRGYQPVLEKPNTAPATGGYQPTSTGDSPANVPTPPKER